MKCFIPFLFIVCALFLFGNAGAQEIPISTELTSNAEVFEVKRANSQGLRVTRINFGNYRITDGKKGFVKNKGGSNFFGTHSESESKQKIDFAFTNGTGEIWVETFQFSRTDQRNSFRLNDNIQIGENKVLSHFDSLYAQIVENGETSWLLKMDLVQITFPNGFAGILSNPAESRVFEMMTVFTEDTKSRMFPMPARGLVFFSGQEEVAALQYTGLGSKGMRQKKVWLKNNLEPKEKMAIAASMAAFLLKSMDYIMPGGGML